MTDIIIDDIQNSTNQIDSINPTKTNPTQINLANLKLLSHSAIQLFRSCPRKFELDRLYGSLKKDENTIHTAYGSALGAGIQSLLETHSIDQASLTAFRNWSIGLDEVNVKAYKSFPQVINALKIFHRDFLPEFQDWELAYITVDSKGNPKPAAELSFSIDLPLGYHYRGFLDAVLKHKKTGKYRVLEIKTTGSRFVDEANYANSFQGVGYSVVLDRIATEGYSDYEVLYLVYKTFNQTYETYPFLKLQSHRINWLTDLILVVEQIELYKRSRRFSTNGDSCKAFGRLCRFFEECNYSNESIFRGAEIINVDTFDHSAFDFNFTYEELLMNQSNQLKKGI